MSVLHLLSQVSRADVKGNTLSQKSLFKIKSRYVYYFFSKKKQNYKHIMHTIIIFFSLVIIFFSLRPPRSHYNELNVIQLANPNCNSVIFVSKSNICS